ncbi:hypothetical protein HPB51_019961 [Rhipicephalus microplus]|uniref:Uncharacterized protein n=1 Tax=Rhipicephalus microplus TaxID=6941 RepID=A0A9J6DCH8_RHIMP|nr:hypothetical protein HPB51_019961 [Rhipicephalus microplus]
MLHLCDGWRLNSGARKLAGRQRARADFPAGFPCSGVVERFDECGSCVGLCRERLCVASLASSGASYIFGPSLFVVRVASKPAACVLSCGASARNVRRNGVCRALSHERGVMPGAKKIVCGAHQGISVACRGGRIFGLPSRRPEPTRQSSDPRGGATAWALVRRRTSQRMAAKSTSTTFGA